MKTLYKLTLLAVLLIGGATVNAQTFRANYDYDENGNRRSTTLVDMSQPNPNTAPTIHPKIDEEIKVDPNTKLTISIFPNPTQGELRVELAGATDEQLTNPDNLIRIWDIQGKLLYTTGGLGTSNTIDFSHYSKGTYIMQLFFGGKVKDFKIIKN